MPGDGFGLVRRCPVRQPPPRCIDAACGGGGADRTGAAWPRLHGLVRAAQSARLRLRMGLARRTVERPHAARRLRRRRRRSAVGSGERRAQHRAGRTAQADDREHPRPAAPVDEGQPAVRGPIHAVLERHARTQAPAVAVSDLAGHQCRAAFERAGRFRRLGACAQARRHDRGWLDDAFGQSRRISALVGLHSQGRPRERPRHVGVRQRSLSPHQRERGQAGGTRRFQKIPRPPLFSRLHQSAAGSLADLWLAAGVRRAHQTVQGVGLPPHHLRISTMGDPMAQLRRLVEDVLPYVD
jgi:hypothetical protein